MHSKNLIVIQRFVTWLPAQTHSNNAAMFWIRSRNRSKKPCVVTRQTVVSRLQACPAAIVEFISRRKVVRKPHVSGSLRYADCRQPVHVESIFRSDHQERFRGRPAFIGRSFVHLFFCRLGRATRAPAGTWGSNKSHVIAATLGFDSDVPLRPDSSRWFDVKRFLRVSSERPSGVSRRCCFPCLVTYHALWVEGHALIE